MQDLSENPIWNAVTEPQRQKIIGEIAVIAARFAQNKTRDYNDCMEHCAEMQQAMMEHCMMMGGDAMSAACGLHVEHATSGCYKTCHEANGIPNEIEPS